MFRLWKRDRPPVAIPVKDWYQIPQQLTDINDYLKRGKAYLGRRNYDQAIADYDHVIKSQPNNAKAYLYRAIAHTLNGKDKKAAIDDYNHYRDLKRTNLHSYQGGNPPVIDESESLDEQPTLWCESNALLLIIFTLIIILGGMIYLLS